MAALITVPTIIRNEVQKVDGAGNMRVVTTYRGLGTAGIPVITTVVQETTPAEMDATFWTDTATTAEAQFGAQGWTYPV